MSYTGRSKEMDGIIYEPEGSHYIYEKNGRTYPVPYHGAKEMGKGLEKKINKEMGLK